jgi:hypothetical protein
VTNSRIVQIGGFTAEFVLMHPACSVQPFRSCRLHLEPGCLCFQYQGFPAGLRVSRCRVQEKTGPVNAHNRARDWLEGRESEEIQCGRRVN